MIIKNIMLCSSKTQQYISDFHTSNATHRYKRRLVVA